MEAELPEDLSVLIDFQGCLISRYLLISRINENSFFVLPAEGFIGATLGIGFLYGIAKFYKIVWKKEGMGMGDIKLIGALGLWLGWKGIIFIIIINFLSIMK